MGFDRNSVNFLTGEMRRGLTLGKTLTLGHQSIYMDQTEYAAALTLLGATKPAGSYSDEFLACLGCKELHIMDASEYEGASIIHDLNQKIPSSLKQSFDCVIDGGTLEHVFNFPTAVSSCMEMVRKSGVFILMTPWHNYPGHGLYQFSPELFYSVLSPSNGFIIERMLISVGGRWYKVSDPSVIRGRVEIDTNIPVMLHITARRVEIKPIFEVWPQQSDYLTAWTTVQKATHIQTHFSMSSLKDFLINHLKPIRLLQSRWRQNKRRRHLSPKRNKSLELLKDDVGVPLE